MKYFLALCLSLFFIGCSDKKPNAITYPSWYLSFPTNNSLSLFGVGQGADINVAKASALSYISDSLSLTISSNLQKSERSHRSNGEEDIFISVSSSLHAQAKEIEFSQFKIIRNEQIGSTFVVLIEVSREELFNDYRSKLNLFSKELRDEEANISHYPFIKQGLLYKKRAFKSSQLRSMALLTQIINPQFNVRTYIEQSRKVAEASQRVLNKVKVYIHASNEAWLYIDSITKGFNDVGIKTGFNDATTHVYIKNKFKMANIYGFSIAKATLVFDTKLNKEVISSNTLILSGKSKYDYPSAKNDTNELLRRQIDREGIFSILGLD